MNQRTNEQKAAVTLASLDGRPSATFPKSRRLAFPGDASSVPRVAAAALSKAAVRNARREETLERYAGTLRDFDFQKFTHRQDDEKARKSALEGGSGSGETRGLPGSKNDRAGGGGSPGKKRGKNKPPEKHRQPGGTVALLSKFAWYKGPSGRSGGHREENLVSSTQRNRPNANHRTLARGHFDSSDCAVLWTVSAIG